MANKVNEERSERIDKLVRYFENVDLKPKPGEYLEGECIEFSSEEADEDEEEEEMAEQMKETKECPYCKDVKWFGEACCHPTTLKDYALYQRCQEVKERDECKKEDSHND